MPRISYHADAQRLMIDLVQATNTLPQLLPLLASHPLDCFSAAAPWFNCLDPSRQGMAFSRRYGWDMAAMTDLPPPGQAIWIRKLDSTPGLAFFDYNDSRTPLTWNPCFGTEASTNALAWNGMMWHFAAAARPGTNTFRATFELFLLDTSTGKEVAGSSTGPFDLGWTNAPELRPTLELARQPGNQITISWVTNALRWHLLSSGSLDEGDWLPVPEPAEVINGKAAVHLDAPSVPQFWRLRYDP